MPKLRPSPDTAPERLETGTQNHEAIAGAAAAIDFLASLAPTGSRRERLSIVFDELHARHHEFIQHLWDGLEKINGVTVYGPPPDAPRTSTISFVVNGKRSRDVTAALADKGLFTSNGNFYAQTVVERLGVEGLVRAGFGCYTTADEVDRLLRAIESLV
jgi:selenocysteine lyase/cysteine desulfurase